MHKYHNFSQICDCDFFYHLAHPFPLFSLCCDSKVKHYLILSDETGKKLSPPTPAAEIKSRRQGDSQRNMLKVSVLLLEYGKIAYFQIQPHQAVFFFSWLFVE